MLLVRRFTTFLSIGLSLLKKDRSVKVCVSHTKIRWIPIWTRGTPNCVSPEAPLDLRVRSACILRVNLRIGVVSTPSEVLSCYGLSGSELIAGACVRFLCFVEDMSESA